MADNTHAPELERSVIGAVFLEPSSYYKVHGTLTPDDFYDPRYRAIYKAICEAVDDGHAIDILAVNDRLKRLGGIDAEYLIDILDSTPTSAAIRTHANIIKDHATRRKLALVGRSIQDMAKAEDLDEAIAYARDAVYSGLERPTDKVFTLDGVLSRLDFKREAIYKTGYADLDRLMGPMSGGELVIVAGRPSIGKTSFALSLARNMSTGKAGALLFSLEMSADSVGLRLAAAACKKEYSSMTEEDVAHARKVLEGVDIRIDDHSTATPSYIRAKTQEMTLTGSKPSVVVVDYLQLMTPDKRHENRNLEVASMTRALKALAKDIDRPVICLSQLSRQVEGGGKRKPALSDLRDSGAIEQDADRVLMLHQPQSDNDKCKVIEVMVGKNRNGATGCVRLVFVGTFMRFENLA